MIAGGFPGVGDEGLRLHLLFAVDLPKIEPGRSGHRLTLRWSAPLATGKGHTEDTIERAEMSCDFAIWSSADQLDDEEAGKRYLRITEGDDEGLSEEPALDALYFELVAKHPEIDDVPEEQVDDTVLCPWSSEIERASGYLRINCVRSRAEYVQDLLKSLAKKHKLSLFDPQLGEVFHP